MLRLLVTRGRERAGVDRGTRPEPSPVASCIQVGVPRDSHGLVVVEEL